MGQAGTTDLTEVRNFGPVETPFREKKTSCRLRESTC